MSLFRGMDRSALDAAYNNREAVPGFAVSAKGRAERSARVRQQRQFHSDLHYGPGRRERLDFFPAQRANAPVLVFIHGGYWQTTDKEQSSFLVEGPLSHGFAVAIVEYTLAPEATIDQIVREIDRALTWLQHHVTDHGGDPRHIYVSGHSAGGHLTAMLLSHPAVAGALTMSGLFDLEPIRLCYLNDLLGLDVDSASRHSPILNMPPSCPALVVSVGDAELPELRRQSAEYAAAMKARGLPSRYLPLAGHDHFSILEELENPQGLLCQALMELRGSTRPDHEASS